MKILIVETVWMAGSSYGLFDKTLLTAFSILPTLHARQIAAITPASHTVTLINERYQKINFDVHYDIVHINFTTSTAPRAYEIADAFRKQNVTVVLSGLHASGIPEEAKRHADSVLLGRGELNWLQLLHDYDQGNLQPLYEPLPYDNTVTIPPTNVRLPGFTMTGAIEATRGCPYHCDFCPEGNLKGHTHFYMRPVDEVIAEIKKLPQKTIMFYDSSLTINPSYTHELFEQMKGLGKKFFCNGNADVLARDVELVRLSKKAGCISWLIGFESVNQDALESCGKSTNNVEDYQQAADNIHEARMAVIGDFIVGFDTDTPDVFGTTLATIAKLRIDVADFCILTPFPGTPLYRRLEQEDRLLTKDWSRYTLKNVVFTPKHMTPEQLQQGVTRMYQRFYSPHNTMQRIARGATLGVSPFFMIIARNAVAVMNSRSLAPKEIRERAKGE
jgi:radical SAM superfamily enzyme YgiQ (UPF0313 family)